MRSLFKKHGTPLGQQARAIVAAAAAAPGVPVCRGCATAKTTAASLATAVAATKTVNANLFLEKNFETELFATKVAELTASNEEAKTEMRELRRQCKNRDKRVTLLEAELEASKARTASIGKQLQLQRRADKDAKYQRIKRRQQQAVQRGGIAKHHVLGGTTKRVQLQAALRHDAGKRRLRGGTAKRAVRAATKATEEAVAATFASEAAELDAFTAYFKKYPAKLAAMSERTGHDLVVARATCKEVELHFQTNSFAAKNALDLTDREFEGVRHVLMHNCGCHAGEKFVNNPE